MRHSKILLIILSIFLLAGIVYAKGVYYYAGETVTSSDPCSCATATYMFCYTGDYTADTDKACFTNGDVSKDGTIVDATVSADYVEFLTANDYIKWVVASEDGLSDDQPCSMFFTLYIIDDGNSDIDENALWESYADADNKMYAYVNDAGDVIYFVWVGQGTSQYIGSGAITYGTTYRVGMSWQQAAGNDIAISVVAKGNATSWTEEDDDLVLWHADHQPDDIIIGEENAAKQVNDTVRISDPIVLSGYKATDPNP